MTYFTVFDAAAEPMRNWWFPAWGLIFVAIGLVIVFRPTILPFGQQLLRQRGFCWFYLIFALAWTLGSGLSVGLDNYHAINALRTGDYEAVEGRVENFRPMPWEGHSEESFDVNGVHFRYSDYVVTAGFNNSTSHGGPIRPGLPVRIAHKDGQILRLDVAR